MVCVTALLDDAHARGLTLRAEADRLVIYGPKRAAATAERLLRHKPEVLAVLRPGPCPSCGSPIAWREAAGGILCAACHPKPKGADKVLCIELAGGATAWVDYAEELTAARVRQSIHG